MNGGRVIFYDKKLSREKGGTLKFMHFSPTFSMSEGPIRKELRSLYR